MLQANINDLSPPRYGRLLAEAYFSHSNRGGYKSTGSRHDKFITRGRQGALGNMLQVLEHLWLSGQRSSWEHHWRRQKTQRTLRR